MVVPINPNRTVPYIDDVDREGGKPEGKPLPGHTVWRLHAPTLAQRQAIADESYAMTMAAEGDEAATGARGRRFLALQGTTRILRVRAGLAGVENFPGWTTEKCPMGSGRDVPTEAFLSTVPDEVLGRLESRVRELTALDEGDVGKSEPQSTPATATSPSDPPAESATG